MNRNFAASVLVVAACMWVELFACSPVVPAYVATLCVTSHGDGGVTRTACGPLEIADQLDSVAAR